jgi:hypothetical protein
MLQTYFLGFLVSEVYDYIIWKNAVLKRQCVVCETYRVHKSVTL